MGVMDAACALTEVKENKSVKTDGAKTKVFGFQLIDANFAGTSAALNVLLFFAGEIQQKLESFQKDSIKI